MSASGMAMDSLNAHRPGVAPSYGMSVAHSILSPMVVDGVVVQDNFSRTPSAGSQSDMWGSQRIGTPAYQSWGYATTGSASQLVPRRVSSNGSFSGSAGAVGSLGFSSTWQAGQPRPGSFRAQMAEIQQAGQAEMLTINEDGQFNADEFRRFDDGQLTPRSHLKREAMLAAAQPQAGINGNSNGGADAVLGGGGVPFMTPRHASSLRHNLSSV